MPQQPRRDRPAPQPTYLEVREAGSFSVVRFRRAIADFSQRADEIAEQLFRFVDGQNCLKLAIDLAGTAYLPSSVLGVLARLHAHGVEVHLVNATDAVREVLQITQLDRLIHTNELEVGPWPEPESGPGAPSIIPVAVKGWFVPCAWCSAEARVDKHQLGDRIACGQCGREFTVTAELLAEADAAYAACPECHQTLRVRREHMQRPVACKFCGSTIEIRTIV